MKTLVRLRCCGCGYGVSVRSAPEICPMCHGDRWEPEEWRPFTAFLDDLRPGHVRRSTVGAGSQRRAR